MLVNEKSFLYLCQDVRHKVRQILTEMNKGLKLIVHLALIAAIVALAWSIIKSVQEPVKFNQERAVRETVGIQRLKDIRTLQEAYKGVNGRVTASFDTLLGFYNNGKMDVVMQIGSNDDSLAVVNTQNLRKKNRRITAQEMYKLYQEGARLVFSIKNTINVRDTLFHGRNIENPGAKDFFNVDSLRYIPFSGGEETEMDAIVKTVSGVDVPLFEARMPFKKLLKGMNNQLRINIDAERIDQGRYEGLQVGSITQPNNNAGNWE